MRIITSPTIHVLARTELAPGLHSFEADNNLDFTDPAANPRERLIEVTGRNCYRSWTTPRPGGTKAYIENLLKAGHGSVLESVSWTLMIGGISRTLSHELVRHRHMGYAQESQRYVDASDVAFVIPPAYLALDPDHPIRVAWERSCAQAQEAYKRLVIESMKLPEIQTIAQATDRRKAARESARSVLPGCSETRIAVTMNARAARHFFHLRCSLHADAEIRRLALIIHDILRRDTPTLFSDFSPVVNQDGRTYLVSAFGSI